MGMIEDIDETQKAASAQIKIAEGKKAELKKISAEVEEKSKTINSEAKKVLADLTNSLQQLEFWEHGYDLWVESLKYATGEYAALKKKCAEIEKFYEQLSDEKAERDKAVKGGKSKLSPKDVELLDAVYKKAKQNYDNYSRSGAATAQADYLKSIGDELKQREKEHGELAAEAKRAMAAYDSMLKALSDHGAFLRWKPTFSDTRPDYNAMRAAYDKYFKTFPD